MAKYYTKSLPWTVATAQKYLRSFSIQKAKNETVNDNVSLFSTRTCLFTAANDRSHKCFHRYVQRDINSSHLLHKSTLSGGQSKGHREHGDIGDTYCTLSSNTPVLPPTEKGQRHGEGDREKGGREEGKERRGWGIWTYIQIQKNMYKSYSLQALCSHIYSHRNRQRNHSMAGPSIWDMQVQGLTVRKPSQRYEVWHKNQWSLRGREQWRGSGGGGWEGGGLADTCPLQPGGINHCREVHNQVLPIRALSETRGESSRQLTPHSKRNTLTDTRTFILGALVIMYMTCRAAQCTVEPKSVLTTTLWPNINIRENEQINYFKKKNTT